MGSKREVKVLERTVRSIGKGRFGTSVILVLVLVLVSTSITHITHRCSGVRTMVLEYLTE